MRSAPRRRPSAGFALGAAGLLTGMVALVVALAGTASGLPGRFRVDKNDLRARVVKPWNVQGNAIRPWQLAPRAVHRWHIAQGAVGGAQVDEKSLAIPKAYARVAPDGSISNGKGFDGSDVTRLTEGFYCIGFDGASNIQVTEGIAYFDGDPTPIKVAVADNRFLMNYLGTSLQGLGCPPSADWSVEVSTDSPGITPSITDATFWVTLF